MTRAFTVAVVFALLAVAPRVSFAETKVIQEADRTIVRKRQAVDFSDVAVEGDLQKPEGSYNITKRSSGFKSLIKVRTDFNRELQKSVDNL